MQVNTQTFVEFSVFLHYIWAVPLQISIAIVILWFYLGVAVFAGVAALVLLVPLNAYFMNMYSNSEFDKLVQKDSRVKVINEILNGIKVY